MQRYFVNHDLWTNDEVSVVGNDVHHMIKVMRMSKGDRVICIHESQGAALCKLIEIHEDAVICKILEWIDENRELPVHVTIVQSIGKGDKLEQVVQKGTELGAHAFIPYQAEHSVAKWEKKKQIKKIERLSKIAKEASEQSERIQIPNVHPVCSIQDLLNEYDGYTWCLYAHAEEARENNFDSLSGHLSKVKQGDRILVVFGPEGGFSSQEVRQLKEKGFLSTRLGPRILRMETAPLYFLASLSYHIEENTIN